ncbi:uncharacterized protein LOC120359502 [Solenopsis invicta]|uniref:uncharacterized protein LOC120357269 n=1 Tax=Solenopsis invicta TaxID=13686 RepID=UPI000E33FB33|nr:uncharacterized protein LOC120357269 [Solenopsis invicta]XP_039313072.1 uncharacterized protein LOC120359502 [Solenopsis invicta]
MANQQASNNSAKRTGIPDISEMHNDERRSERFPMLLTTTYGLNNSHTKRILVGLQTTKKGIFEPVVKLSGSNADGVYFDAESWLQFQENMGVMSDYLNANNKFKPEPVVIKNISVIFTSSYGSKSLLLTYKEKEKSDSAENTNEEGEDSAPPMKKRKLYAVAIVMQKTTFLGLENVMKCVDAYLEHLKTLSNIVNECAHYLIKEIELKLPKSYVDRDIIKLTLKGNYSEIERDVRTQIKDLTFLDMYFNIIFLEITLLRFDEIVHIILSNHRS